MKTAKTVILDLLANLDLAGILEKMELLDCKVLLVDLVLTENVVLLVLLAHVVSKYACSK